MDDLQAEAQARYDAGERLAAGPVPDQLENAGVSQWRPDGEEHLIDPETIFALRCAVRTGDEGAWRTYSSLLHRPGRAVTLRDLLDFDDAGRTPVPIEQVEPVESIVRRFRTGAMSYGSISREAHDSEIARFFG